MNRIVREHYPVSKLPEDLRDGLSDDQDVRVTIETSRARPADQGDGSAAGAKPLSSFKHLRRANFGSGEEVDAYVRALRDEWSHRER